MVCKSFRRTISVLLLCWHALKIEYRWPGASNLFVKEEADLRKGHSSGLACPPRMSSSHPGVDASVHQPL